MQAVPRELTRRQAGTTFCYQRLSATVDRVVDRELRSRREAESLRKAPLLFVQAAGPSFSHGVVISQRPGSVRL